MADVLPKIARVFHSTFKLEIHTHTYLFSVSLVTGFYTLNKNVKITFHRLTTTKILTEGLISELQVMMII